MQNDYFKKNPSTKNSSSDEENIYFQKSSSPKKIDLDTKESVNYLKPRLIVSAVVSFLIMTPMIFQRPEKFLGILLFTFISFIIIFIISSLVNIRDTIMRIIFSSIVGLSFAYKFYDTYFINSYILQKAIIVSLSFAVVYALIFRGISILTEKGRT